MTKSGLPKSLRKHIRLRKAAIRSSVVNPEERKRKIAQLYQELGISVADNKQEAKEK